MGWFCLLTFGLSPAYSNLSITPCTSAPTKVSFTNCHNPRQSWKANKKLLKTSSTSLAFYLSWVFIIIEPQIPMPSVIIFRVSVVFSLWDCLLAVQACAQFNHIWFIAHWFLNANRCRWTLIEVRASQFNCGVTTCGGSNDLTQFRRWRQVRAALLWHTETNINTEPWYQPRIAPYAHKKAWQTSTIMIFSFSWNFWNINFYCFCCQWSHWWNSVSSIRGFVEAMA